jgi:hypothetical protein
MSHSKPPASAQIDGARVCHAARAYLSAIDGWETARFDSDADVRRRSAADVADRLAHLRQAVAAHEASTVDIGAVPGARR